MNFPMHRNGRRFQVGEVADELSVLTIYGRPHVGTVADLVTATLAVHRKFIARLGGQNSTGEYGSVQ